VIFAPGNESPNIVPVVGVLVVIRFSIFKVLKLFHFSADRKLRILISHNIPDSRTASHFKVLIN